MDITMYISSLTVGGAERVCVTLGNYWVSQGKTVNIIVLNSKDALLEKELDSQINLTVLHADRIRSGILPLIRYLRKRKTKIILVFDFPMAIALLEAKKFGIIQTEIICRNLTNNKREISSNQKTAGIMKKILIKYEKELSNAGAVIAQCRAMKKMLIEQNGIDEKKVVSIYNPLSSELEHMEGLRSRGKKNRITFAGRLDAVKNVDQIIEAFAMIHESMPGTILTIFGDGEEKERLLRLIEEKKLEEKVQIVPFEQNLRELYLESDVVVLASDHEGLPNVLIEAIAAGTPVVSYDCPTGPDEIIIDGVNGFLVKQFDIKELAEKMKMAAEYEWDHESIRKSSEKFHIASVAQQYLDVFYMTERNAGK